MALEELSLSSGVGVGVGVNGGGGDEGGSKAPRLPRWTRHEILVLIQGKRVAENRVRRGRTTALTPDSGQLEPKWASVSSYCRRHGVNRGPVQCRKRWSNLAGDFKKIKEWESHQVKEDSESFWVMRNDLRRERKLPGFFDKEVYDILDGTVTPPPPLALSLSDPDPNPPPAEPSEALFDSGRSAAPDDGLFSDFEQDDDKDVSTPIQAPKPISEKQYQPFAEAVAGQGMNEKQPASNPEIGSTSHHGKKRKQSDDAELDDETEAGSVRDHLIQVLEKNGRIIGAHLEAQNTNMKLDREERKDHANSLIAVLNKLADSLGRIADKL